MAQPIAQITAVDPFPVIINVPTSISFFIEDSSTFSAGDLFSLIAYIGTNDILANAQINIDDSTVTFNNLIFNELGSWSFDLQNLNGPGQPIYEVTPSNIQVSCFLKETEILCLDVENNTEIYVPIEEIQSGCLIKTLNNGFIPVKYNLTNKMKSNQQDKNKANIIYKLSVDDYSELHKDLYITGGHSILVDSLDEKSKIETMKIWKELSMVDDKFKLLTFLNEKAVPIEDGEYEIYHLVLQDGLSHAIYANGLLTETMDENYFYKHSNMKIVSYDDTNKKHLLRKKSILVVN
jgi:hypothetical protein